MQRATWKGTISFGLVNVPVCLYTSASEQGVKLSLVSKGGVKVKQVRMAAGQPIEWEDCYRGVELDKDKYLVLDPAEIEALAPGRSKSIEIEQTGCAAHIDPYNVREYHIVGPDKAGAKAYALFRDALQASEMVAIGRVVLGSRERLVALQVRGETIVMATLAYADEITDPAPMLVRDGELESPDPQVLEMAVQVMKSMAKPFDHSSYTDDYRQKLLELIERKSKSKSSKSSKRKPAPNKLIDELEASLMKTKTKTNRKVKT